MITSPLVREMLMTDFGRRYGTKGGYSGGRYLDEIEQIGESLACGLFRSKYAVLSPITGHVALEAILAAFTQAGDTIVVLDPADGGYPTGIAERLGLRVVPFVFDRAAFNLDVAANQQRIAEAKPRLVMFGSGRYLFAHPIAKLADVCRSVGALIAYDASHPLGLIAGGVFDDPFAAGVDVLFGSTSKTFFGPTRGLILVRDDPGLHERIIAVFQKFILQSTYHLNSLAGLCASLAEMTAFGSTYAAEVVANAKRFAWVLHQNGVEVTAFDQGGTDAQLVLPQLGWADATIRDFLQRRLEAAGLLSDRFLRLGVQQITRLGMGRSEMDTIAQLVARVLTSHDDASVEAARREVEHLASGFQTLRYTFDGDANAFEYTALHAN
jgi:glycine hydroxymethyltransferase